MYTICTSLTLQVISNPHMAPQRTSPLCQTVCMLTQLWMMSQWHSQPSLAPQLTTTVHTTASCSSSTYCMTSNYEDDNNSSAPPSAAS